ncbi:DsbA family protein [Ornithinimicrobium murale]|uniref:DsbA family protein n=1 Tax=Ornithinimicrobium murale TaxID=1050153 RepID=UPI0013B43437|nr:thioredoxin domain-containing protein [Ornithinimicrobium murale]
MSTPSGQVPPGNEQPSAPIAPIPQPSGQTRSNTASIMWAVATIVVALVGGFLIYTAMTQGDEPADAGPGTAQEGGAATGSEETEGADPAEPTDEVAEAPAAETRTEPATEGSDGTDTTAEPTMSEEQKQFLLDLPRREADDPLAMGDVDAPVVIIEYADYRCPFCASWGRDVQPQLQDLVDDGTLRIEFRDRVLFGADSEATALAARAAGEQGMYWEFHDAVYAAAPDSGHPDMPREKLLGLAEEIAIPDLEKFEADLDSPELREAMQADNAEGESLGVRSTPTFLVNTVAIVGAQPEQVFRQAIEQELAAVQ